jgi:hypothetical protein
MRALNGHTTQAAFMMARQGWAVMVAWQGWMLRS